MAATFEHFIESQAQSPEQIAARARTIYDTVLRQSPHLDGANFSRLRTDDLLLLFELYDEHFFAGGVRTLLAAKPLTFRLSSRMTRAAGKVARREVRTGRGWTARKKTEFELTVSTTLLLQTFQEDHRPVRMSGIVCFDRLSALQRIVEHELVHLVEMLLWVKSSCRARRFQSMANRLFAHTEHLHQLITPQERALTQFGIRPGDRVSFRYDGRHYAGFVNRITRRATVLVEDRRGKRYTDGKRYAAYYVPVARLKRL